METSTTPEVRVTLPSSKPTGRPDGDATTSVTSALLTFGGRPPRCPRRRPNMPASIAAAAAMRTVNGYVRVRVMPVQTCGRALR